MRLLPLLFITLLSLLSPSVEASELACNEAFGRAGIHQTERLYGREIEYQKIPSSELNRSVFSSHDLDSANAIFLGIQTDGHSYLVVNKRRYDGQSLYSKPTISKSAVVSQGVVFRIADPEGKLSAPILKMIEEQTFRRTFNCVLGVCSLLGQPNEIGFADGPIHAVFPEKLLKQLLTKDVVDSSGTNVDVQTFVIGDYSLRKLNSEMTKNSYAEAAAYGMASLAFVVFPTFLFVH